MDIHRYIKTISRILNIKPPKSKIVEKLDTDTKMAAVDPVRRIITIKKGLLSYDMLFVIAHELRHLWQYENMPDIFNQYKDSSTLSIEEYNLQEAELDANAFGKIIMIDIFGVKPLFDGLSDNVKTKIDEHEQIIRKEIQKSGR